MKRWKQSFIGFLVVVVITAVVFVIMSPETTDPQDARSRHQRLLLLNTASLVRSAVSAYYWQHVDPGTGRGRYPKMIEENMFPDDKVPRRTFGIYAWVYDPETGEVTIGKSFYGKMLVAASKTKFAIRGIYKRVGNKK